MFHFLKLGFVACALLALQACTKPSTAHKNYNPQAKVSAKARRSHVLHFNSTTKKAGSYRDTIDIGGANVGGDTVFNIEAVWDGNVQTTINSVNISGTGFSVTTDCPPGTYAEPLYCIFAVRLAPTTTGVYTGQINIPFTTKFADGSLVSDTASADLVGRGIRRPTKNPCPTCPGSTISPVARTLAEEIPLVGTDFVLQYNSRLASTYVTDEGQFVSAYGYNQEAWVISAHKFYDDVNQRLFDGDGASSAKAFFEISNDTYLVSSSDGSEIYVFDDTLKHIKTLTALTGATKYEFNYTSDLLTSIVDSYGNTTSITRNGSGYITRITGPYGQQTNFTLSAAGRFLTATNPKSEKYTFTYKSGTGLLATFKKPGNQVTTLTYDANGRLIKDLGHGTNFFNFTIGGSGQIIRTSKMGRAATYTSSYSSAGVSTQTVTETDALATQYSEDNSESSTTTNAIESITTTKTDDARLGTLLKTPSSRTYTIGGVTSTATYTQAVVGGTNFFDYTSLSNSVSVAGRVATSVFDNTTKQVTTTSPQGVVSTVKLNSYEKPYETQHGADSAVTYSYDVQGRLSQTLQGLKNQLNFAYNAAGFLQTVTNIRSEVTSYIYDLAGRLTQTTLPDLRVIQYSYDANGNVTSVTPPGRSAHTFTVNAMELPYTALSPSAVASTTYAYNLDKQMTSITKPSGQVATYTYNSTTGLLTQIAAAAGNYTYTYSSVVPGQVDIIQSPYGVKNSYTYRGPVLSADEQIRSSDSVSMGKVSFGFDASHRVTSRVIRDSAATTFTRSMTLNDDDQPTQVGDLSLVYNSTSGRLSTTTISKISDARTYDSFGNLTGYTVNYTPTSGPVVTLYSYTLTRDLMSRISEVNEVYGGVGTNLEYIYDSAGRLTDIEKNYSVAVGAFTYDSNSNRTSQTLDGVTTAAVFDGQDKITSFGSKTYTYNNSGDLTQSQISPGPINYYSYDVFGNLTQSTPTSGVTYNYIIDASNRVAGKTVSGTVQRRYLYQDKLRIAAQLNSSGVMQKEFVYATGSQAPDYMLSGGNKYRIITNHLGSPRLVVNVDDGTLAQVMEYNVFGLVTADSAPDFQPFGFAGGIYDQDTKLVRFGARDYDAETGRWTTKDPIGFAGGDANLYGYVLNDPVNFVDPSGYKIGDEFKKPEDAAKDAIKEINPKSISEDIEYAGTVDKNTNGTYSASEARPGTAHRSDFLVNKKTCAALYHTHGDVSPNHDDEDFSPKDKANVKQFGVPSYLGTPSGKIKVYKGK